LNKEGLTIPAVKQLNERDAKLVQWLGEAHAKEAELEADLTAHIALTEKAPYKKRLQQHLKETREHKRSVARRIKSLGGGRPGADIPGVPGAVGEAAGKTVAAVKGQVGSARALVTSQPETHLRNAQEELREENVEIALYTRLETLATAVGDKETAQLAKRIRRDEERMAKFLTSELSRLVKELVRDQIPRDQRAQPTRSRSRSSSRASSSTSGSRASSSKSSSSARSSRAGSGSTRSGSGSTRSGSGTTRSGSGSTRSSSRSSGSRSTGGSGNSRSGSGNSRSSSGNSRSGSTRSASRSSGARS
jgi:ferritin-like metal-binding protein YciE